MKWTAYCYILHGKIFHISKLYRWLKEVYAANILQKICQLRSIIGKHYKSLFKISVMTFNSNENTGAEHVMMFESKKTQKFVKAFFFKCYLNITLLPLWVCAMH